MIEAPVSRRRLIPVITYATIFIVAAVGLIIVLPKGNAIIPAPQALLVGSVTGSAVECLGERVATVQSGVFLDIHVPGTHGNETEDLGPKIVGGRLEQSGSGVLSGSCAPGSALEGSSAAFEVVVAVRRIDDRCGDR